MRHPIFYPFHDPISTLEVGILWMLMGEIMIVAQGLLTDPLTKKFGEMKLICFGMGGGAPGFWGMSLAHDTATSLRRVIGPYWAGYLFDITIEYSCLSSALGLAVDLLICLLVWKRLAAEG